MPADRPSLLVLTSTFPRWADDDTPRFIEHLGYELARSFRIVILAPHYRGAETHEKFGSGSTEIDVFRYRYSLPALETLAYDGGMMAAVRGKPWRLLQLPMFLVAQLFSAMRLHRRYRFSAVHAHWIIPQGLVAVMLCRLVRRAPRLLVTSHGSDLYGLKGGIVNRLKRWVLKRADSVSVVSEAMKQHCEEGSYASNVIVQPMGVDLDTLFTPGDGTHRRDGLVFVGRLVEVKGVEYLVRAMELLVKQSPKLRLRIVGDGPLRGMLQDLAASLNLANNIEFVGSVAHADLPRVLRSARIFVMPSIQEGLGLVAVEAMGCGCAVVASDLPTIRDTVQDGVTGLTAEVANSKDLADKISRLLRDEEFRIALADRGREAAKARFAWSMVGRRYTEIINDMLI
jgi:glycosyltransferase involved in cell wall biosynthesis